MGYDKKTQMNNEQKLILISEAIIKNLTALTSNFIDLLNELLAGYMYDVNKDENRRFNTDEDFRKANNKIKISDEWIKNFIEQNKAGKVCKDYDVALRGKDILKDYSRLLQSAYKATGNNNSSGYKSKGYDYRNNLYRGLQDFRRLQENLLRLPRVLKSDERSRGVAGSNSYAGSLGKLRNLYLNLQNDTAYNKDGELCKSLDAYFNN